MIKEKSNRKRVKKFRTYRIRKFVNNRINKYFKNKGIVHHLACAFTPEQIGVAERKSHSLIEITKWMLYEANIDINFWAEAVNTKQILVFQN